MAWEFTIKKSDEVRVDHEKNTDRVRVNSKKKRDRVRVYDNAKINPESTWKSITSLLSAGCRVK